MNKLDDVLKGLEDLLNSGTTSEFIMTGMVTKGLVGRSGKYSFIVRSNDHPAAHFHVQSKDGSIRAAYFIEPFSCREGGNSRLNTMVEAWFNNQENKRRVLEAWKRTEEANK